MGFSSLVWPTCIYGMRRLFFCAVGGSVASCPAQFRRLAGPPAPRLTDQSTTASIAISVHVSV